MNRLIIALFCFFSASAFAGSGTLIIAHGSMTGGHHRCGNNPTDWEQAVIDSVDNIRSSVNKDLVLTFGMWNTMCFNMGVKKLRKKLRMRGETLDEINILPLFISSHSVVIEMQKWMFGLRKVKPIPFLKDVKKVNFEGKVNYLKAMDYHEEVSSILQNRAASLMEKASIDWYKESEIEFVIVMHGPVLNSSNRKWLKMGNQYLKDILNRYPMARGHVVSLQDDAPKYIRNKRTKELREKVSNAYNKEKIALVLPLLLSHGGIEQGILKRLEGLKYVWTGETILPDKRLENFLIERLRF